MKDTNYYFRSWPLIGNRDLYFMIFHCSIFHLSFLSWPLIGKHKPKLTGPSIVERNRLQSSLFNHLSAKVRN